VRSVTTPSGRELLASRERLLDDGDRGRSSARGTEVDGVADERPDESVLIARKRHRAVRPRGVPDACERLKVAAVGVLGRRTTGLRRTAPSDPNPNPKARYL
jgi:hypothetical protein